MNEIDKIGEAIERLKNLEGAMKLPMSDAIHMQALRSALPNVIAQLVDAYVCITGDDPWADQA